MQRYANGLAVPAYHTDFFESKTSGGSGEITLNLTHLPKSIDEIIIESGFGPGFVPRFYLKDTLVGKALGIIVTKLIYYQPNTPTGTTDAAGGGAVAEPHSHTITCTTTTDAEHTIGATELQKTIIVSYPVHG